MDVFGKYIDEKDSLSLKVVLSRTPLEDLTEQQFEQVLVQLLTLAKEKKATPRVLTVILERIGVALSVNDMNVLVGMIAGVWSVNEDLVRWIIDKMELQPFNILKEMLSLEGVVFPMIADKVSKGKDETINWLALLKESSSNPNAVPYLESKVHETSPNAKIPSWVKGPPDGFEWAPVLNACTFDTGEWAGVNTTNMDPEDRDPLSQPMLRIEKFIDEKEMPDDMVFRLTQLAASSAPYPYNPDEDKFDPDMVFGPRNSCIGRECRTGLKGGCRMLTCTCRSFDEEEESSDYSLTNANPESWWEGNCDGCNYRIRDPSHSVRFPIVGGGYVGCFCGIECMLNKPPREVGGLEQLLIGSMANTLKEKGIIDRLRIAKIDEAINPTPNSNIIPSNLPGLPEPEDPVLEESATPSIRQQPLPGFSPVLSLNIKAPIISL